MQPVDTKIEQQRFFSLRKLLQQKIVRSQMNKWNAFKSNIKREKTKSSWLQMSACVNRDEIMNVVEIHWKATDSSAATGFLSKGAKSSFLYTFQSLIQTIS